MGGRASPSAVLNVWAVSYAADVLCRLCQQAAKANYSKKKNLLLRPKGLRSQMPERLQSELPNRNNCYPKLRATPKPKRKRCTGILTRQMNMKEIKKRRRTGANADYD